MRACGNCGAMVNREYDHGSSIGWTCHAAKTEIDALRAELRDLRMSVLEIAELAQTTEGEDTGKFLAYRLREAAKP